MKQKESIHLAVALSTNEGNNNNKKNNKEKEKLAPSVLVIAQYKTNNVMCYLRNIKRFSMLYSLI